MTDRSALLREAWRRGALGHLLHSAQRRILADFDASPSRRYVVCSSRRLGKSWLGCVRAVSQCIRNPGYQYRYAAPTQVMARSIVYPHLRKILATCPDDLRPKVNVQEMSWTWPNGSVLRLAGCDGSNADRLRGGECHEAFVDEAGFIADLHGVLEDVIMPMTLTTNGRVLLASTPPLSPAHPFAEYVAKAEAASALTRMTIYDAPHISRAKADEYIDEAGGPDSVTARREYMAELVIDEASAIVPEFARVRSEIVVETTPPEWRDVYTVADFGFHDLTVVLFLYFDFPRARIVVEDEIALHGTSGLEVGAAVRAREIQLWGEATKPNRYADAPPQMLADLAHRTLGPGVQFHPVAKVNSDAALNALRMSIQRKEVEIHPRCKTLISHLHYGTWNASRTSFDRVDGYGHWDGIDALTYAVRHVNRKRNPMPDIIPERRGRVDVAQPRTVSQRRPLSAAMRVGSTVRTS